MAERTVSRIVVVAVAAAAVAAVIALVALVPLSPAPAGAQADDTIARGPQLPVDPDADPDRSRDEAREILAGDEYQEPEEVERSIPERVRRWIADRLPDIDLEGGDGSSPAPRLFAYGVVAVVVLGTLAVVARVLAHTRGRRVATEGDTDAEVEVTPLRSTREWEDEAARCRTAGDHRGEVRAWFRATTTALADRGLVPTTPGRTARELGRDVDERAPAASAAFEPLGTLFEAVWYGGAPAGADDGERAEDLSRRVLDAAPRRARPDPSVATDDRPSVSVTASPGSGP